MLDPRAALSLIDELKEPSNSSEIPSTIIFILLTERIDALRELSTLETLRTARQFGRDLGADPAAMSFYEPLRKTAIEVKAWAAIFRLDLAEDLAHAGVRIFRQRSDSKQRRAFEKILKEIESQRKDRKEQMNQELSRHLK